MSTNHKKKSRSVFVVLFVILLLLTAISTVAANVIFSGDRVPMVAGYYLYLQESDEMSPTVPQNSLVLCKDAGNIALQKYQKVLCYLSTGSLAMREIYDIRVNDDGTTSYFPGTNLEQGNDLVIPRSNIIAVCTWASQELYTYVKFATSVAGLMVLLVLPCVILIIMLLVKIAKSSREEIDDEDFFFEEEEPEKLPRKTSKKPQAPLFDPEQAAAASDETLEKKKESLTKNFSAKPVTEDSPYQKAVQERTMKFKKVQQEDIDRANAEEAARSAAAREAAEKPVEQSAPAPAPAAEAPAPEKPAAETPTPAEEKPAYSSPNIDDIINASELRAAKSGTKINPEIAATSSIDDLISALEKEKNKL